MSAKFGRWLLSGFGVGLIPLFVNALIVAFTPITLSWAALFGRGEVLMLSVGLCASAIADVLSATVTKWARRWAVLWCSISIVAATIIYTVQVVASRFRVPISEEAVAVVSLLPYAFSVLVSAGCIVAVERKGRVS